MPDDAQVDPREIIEELRRELAARTAERDEALAEQAAISEIVQIINASPGDLTPVFVRDHPPPRWGRAGVGVMARTEPW